MDLSLFVNVLGAPEVHSDKAMDWDSFEERLGTSLPTDYKDFVSAYGPCELYEMLYVSHPRGDIMNLGDFIDRAIDEIGSLRQEFPDQFPYPVHPEPRGIIPVAETEGGVQVFLTPSGKTAHQWEIAVDWRGSWSRYELGFSEFLFKALTGELDAPFFHESILENPGTRYQVVGHVV